MRRSASGKSFFRPAAPRFDCACARCKAPDIGPAPECSRRLGFQIRSSAAHTGRQYSAVDSIRTSSTCCVTSHSANARSWLGLVPNRRRSNSCSPSALNIGDHNGQHPLMNINPRYSVSHTHLLAGTERAPQNTLVRVSGYRCVQANATTPTYSLNTARAGSTNSSASTAPLARPDLYRSRPATVSQTRE